MMKSLVMLSLILMSFSSFGAKDIKSRISKVTVFPNKVFTTRVLKVAVKAGTGSLNISDLTAVADVSSIKIKVPPSMKGFEVLAVRTQNRILVKTDNPELEKLRNDLKKNQAEISKTNEQIRTVHKSNTNLKQISSHYAESFNVNLHNGLWRKNRFNEILGFVQTKNNQHRSFWKKNYRKMQNLYKKDEFLRNKISKISRNGDRNVLTVTVDYSNKNNVSGVLKLQYLVPAAGWSPAYDLRLNSANKTAKLTQQAYIWQNTGEDWNNVKISLSTETNPDRSDPPRIHQKTLNYKKVEKVKTNVVNKQDAQKTLIGGGSDQGGNAVSASSLTQRYHAKGKFTVLSNHPKVRIPLNSKNQKFSDEFVAIAGKFNRAFKNSTIKNPFSTRMNSGPLFIFRDGKFIQQTYFNSKGPGENFSVNSGFLNNIQVSHSYQHKDSESGVLSKNKKITRKSITYLKSYNNRPVLLKLFDQIPISQLDEVEVNTRDSTDGFKKDENRETWGYWLVSLKPEKHETFVMTVNLNIPEKMDFQWPR